MTECRTKSLGVQSPKGGICFSRGRKAVVRSPAPEGRKIIAQPAAAGWVDVINSMSPGRDGRCFRGL